MTRSVCECECVCVSVGEENSECEHLLKGPLFTLNMF